MTLRVCLGIGDLSQGPLSRAPCVSAWLVGIVSHAWPCKAIWMDGSITARKAREGPLFASGRCAIVVSWVSLLLWMARRALAIAL